MEPNMKPTHLPLLAAIALPSAFADNSDCRQAGGSSSTPTSRTYYDDVQYARIQADGRLYVIGGSDAAGQFYREAGAAKPGRRSRGGEAGAADGRSLVS
jgi:hypothetical protein